MQRLSNVGDNEDDFLAHDDHHTSNLTVEFSESVSVTSTGSSGSSYRQMKEATTRQQENLFSNGKEVRSLYLKFHCGAINASQLREEISNLGIQETGALRRLLNQNDGNSLQYSKFLMSLTHLDEEDIGDFSEVFKPPVKATAPSTTPFATMRDVARDSEVPSSPATTGDILTWSTPPPKASTPSKKKEVKTSFQPSPIPTYQPPSYSPQEIRVPEGEAPAPFTPQDRNALIQAFLGGSISGSEFKRQLRERAGIESSEALDHIISAHESGKTIRYLDIVKELTFLQDTAKFPKIEKASIAESTTRATIDLYNMQEAPEEKRPSNPHSKEQLPEMRKQKNLFTWENTEAEKSLPSRKLGVGAYAGSNDIFDRTPEKPKVNPAIKPVESVKARQDEGDIFTWTTPPKNPQARNVGKKNTNSQAAAGGISSIPWGTANDYDTNENPHAHRLTKKQ